jgi:single-stranded-DNA-specific exonuclease
LTEPFLGVARSLSGRRWRWRAVEERVAFGIAQRLEVPEIVGRLLAARGVAIDAAADFLEPTLRVLLPDPSLLIDMDLAADRLASAVQRAEVVAVFGDYDVDGACGAALIVSFLQRLGCTALHHVPDRILEGYGPNLPALTELMARGASLIVCVDCGTAASLVLEGITARADVIVLDHHKAEGPPRVRRCFAPPGSPLWLPSLQYARCAVSVSLPVEQNPT